MLSGDILLPEIIENVKACSLFVCVLSPGYSKSPWCSDEFKIADETKKKIVPIKWKGVNTCTYPAKFESKYTSRESSPIYHEYDLNPINKAAEDAKCASAIMKQINK